VREGGREGGREGTYLSEPTADFLDLLLVVEPHLFEGCEGVS